MLIVGISGATCSGKTTLALKIMKTLPNIRVISQDDYFRPLDDPKHVWIPELNHMNLDIISSLDMEKMYCDVQNYISNDGNLPMKENCKVKDISIVRSTFLDNLQKQAYEKTKNCNILIIEGFCIFNYKPICDLCNLKYFLTITFEECQYRRSKRIYKPPECAGYLKLCAWPEYKKTIAEVKSFVENVQYMDNGKNECLESILGKIFMDIIDYRQS